MISIMLPGPAIPWNDCRKPQVLRGQRWSATFVLSPEARAWKEWAKPIIEAQLPASTFAKSLYRDAPSLRAGIVTRGQFAWSNPWQRRDPDQRVRYKHSWWFWELHELLLHLCFGGFRDSRLVIATSDLVLVARARFGITMTIDQVVEFADAYSHDVDAEESGARKAPFLGTITRNDAMVDVDLGRWRELHHDWASLLRPREKDLDSLAKLSQDAIFECLWPDMKQPPDHRVHGYMWYELQHVPLRRMDAQIYTLALPDEPEARRNTAGASLVAATPASIRP